MPANGNTKPKIRFTEYAGDWYETPMGELLSFKNGYNAGKEQYGTGKRFINVLDIIENNFITHDRIIGLVDIPPNDFERKEVKFGDILFQRSSETREEVGQATVYLDRDKTATFGGFVIRGRPLTEFNPVFFNFMLKTAKARKDITSRSGGSTRYNIGQESLEDVLVSIAPTLSEQRKIANFLTAVEGRIEHLIHKKALLEVYKKGVMEQLFTQVIRFKDDHGNDFPDWEEKKLGEVGSIVGGGTPDSTNEIYWNGDVQWFTPTEIRSKYASSSKRTISQLGLKKCSASMLPVGTLLLTSRATIAEVSISTKPCTTNQGFQSITVNPDVSNEFVYYWVIQFKKEFLRKAQGSTFLEIGGKEIRKMPISIPRFPEQTKITDFLSAIDRKIESVTTQITEAQTFKRGLLQQMFV